LHSVPVRRRSGRTSGIGITRRKSREFHVIERFVRLACRMSTAERPAMAMAKVSNRIK
jgi:hypothetical protein